MGKATGLAAKLTGRVAQIHCGVLNSPCRLGGPKDVVWVVVAPTCMASGKANILWDFAVLGVKVFSGLALAFPALVSRPDWLLLFRYRFPFCLPREFWEIPVHVL